MKKLSLILASLLALAVCSSCHKEVVEHFAKPTDVVNPNPPAPPTVYEYGLKDLANEVGLKIGAAFTRSEYYQDDSVAVLLKRDFEAVTFGNEMKHGAIGQNDWSALNGSDMINIVEDVAHIGTQMHISDKNTWLSGEKPLLWDSSYNKKDSYEQLYLYLRKGLARTL